MKGFNRVLKNIYSGEGGRWVLGAIVCVLGIAVAFLLETPTFYDVDDQNIAFALAGYRGGAPSYSHPFINCITGFLVSGLYALLPGGPWWYLFQLFAMGAGILCVNVAIAKICYMKHLPLYVPLLAMGLLTGGLFFYPLTLTTFTLSSTVAGCGAVALVFAMAPTDSKKVRRGYAVGSVVLLALCLLVRQSSGLALCCFYGAAVAYRLAADEKGWAARTLLMAAAAIVTAAALTIMNGWGREHLNPPEFLAYDEARAAYMDYPHDTYQENPTLYASMGWDGTLYELVNAWCYMDERVNAETFEAGTEGSAFAQLSLRERIAAGVDAGRSLVNKYPLARYWFMMTGAALLLLASAWLLGGRRWQEPVAGVAVCLGMGILFFYLCFTGRINLRTQMTLVFPATVSLVLLAGLSLGGVGIKRRFIRGTARCLMGATSLLLAFCGYKVFRTVESYESGPVLADSACLMAYVRAHPENMYIREVYAAIDVNALTTYPIHPPTNLMDWGGCDTNTAARQAQLRLNGLSSSYGDVFLTDNVYFVTTENSPYLELMDQWMGDAYGASGYEICDTLANGCVIVKFLP